MPPRKATLDEKVGLTRDVFDLHKAYAERHNWPTIFFPAHMNKKSQRILLEWLMTTEYDLYWYHLIDKNAVLLTKEYISHFNEEGIHDVAIYALPKGTPDATEKVRITFDCL